MIVVSVIEILPLVCLLHFLLPMLWQSDFHSCVREHAVTAPVLYLHFSKLKYYAHKIYYLNLHCVTVHLMTEDTTSVAAITC